MNEGETIGRAVYSAAEVSDVPSGGAAELAVRIFGRTILYEQPRALAEITPAKIGGSLRFVIRAGLSHRRVNFLVASMLARFVGESRPENENAAAAWIVAPTAGFQSKVAQVGVDLEALSSAFAITETCAALRVQECGGPSSIVIANDPPHIHRRGPGLSWIADDDVRRIAALRRPGSVRRAVIRDEPGRVALFAS